MFTGIIEEMGTVKSVLKEGQYIRIAITAKKVLADTMVGDSISVNGICLTVSDVGKDWFLADVMPETIRKTGLDTLKYNDPVNLERALSLNDRLGGHIVSGHIDGIGRIAALKNEGNAVLMRIDALQEIMKYIVLKGSVALDGTSLTVASFDKNGFWVSLIPLTREQTVLGKRKAGDIVNIECDMIGKYVERMMQTKETEKKETDITWEFLKENGYW